MDDIATMQVVQAQADVDEHFPNKILHKGLSVLLPYISAKVPVLAIIHNNIDLCILDEAVYVSNYEIAVGYACE